MSNATEACTVTGTQTLVDTDRHGELRNLSHEDHSGSSWMRGKYNLPFVDLVRAIRPYSNHTVEAQSIFAKPSLHLLFGKMYFSLFLSSYLNFSSFLGVLKAVGHINDTLGPALLASVSQQSFILINIFKDILCLVFSVSSQQAILKEGIALLFLKK